MIIRALDADGDFIFGKGRSDYRTGITATVLDLQTRLNCILGDCFFAINDGIDWFNLIGSKNQIALSLAISARILNTENVQSILSLDVILNRLTRNISITYKVISTFGLITNQVVFSPTNVSSSTYITTEDGSRIITEDGSPLITDN